MGILLWEIVTEKIPFEGEYSRDLKLTREIEMVYPHQAKASLDPN